MATIIISIIIVINYLNFFFSDNEAARVRESAADFVPYVFWWNEAEITVREPRHVEGKN